MPTDDSNFIYAYDDEAHQIIIIDAETGRRIQEKENRILPLLRHFKEQDDEVKLRKFIVWCTYTCNKTIKPGQKKFLELAESAIQQTVETEDLSEVYNQSESEAIAVDTVGLRQGSAKAPGFLASRECVNPDAFEGAKNAARFHCLWAEMNKEEHELPDFMHKVEAAASVSTIKETEQLQIDYLLDLMSE